MKMKKTVDIQPPALVPTLALKLLPEAKEIKNVIARRPKADEAIHGRNDRRIRLKIWVALIVSGATLLCGVCLKAEELSVMKIPHLINFQSILTDPAGVSLPDGLHNVHFRLLDVDGNSIYEESQTVESKGGVVSAMIGSQDDLVSSNLSPSSVKFLGVQVEGGGPETRMEIVSVPYAYYAEEALQVADRSIGTEAIKPKSITADLLAEDVIAKILTDITPQSLPSNIVYANQLESFKSDFLKTSGAFVYSRGGNWQSVVKDLDTAIYQRQVNLDQAKTTLDKKISDETAARTNADIALQQSIASVDNRVTAVDSRISIVNTSISSDYNILDTTLGNVSRDVDALQALPRIVAWGVIESGSLSGRYDISSMTNSAEYVLSFSNPVELPYAVTVTSLDSNANYAVYERTRNGFKIRNSVQSLGPISFIVVK